MERGPLSFAFGLGIIFVGVITLFFFGSLFNGYVVFNSSDTLAGNISLDTSSVVVDEDTHTLSFRVDRFDGEIDALRIEFFSEEGFLENVTLPFLENESSFSFHDSFPSSSTSLRVIPLLVGKEGSEVIFSLPSSELDTISFDSPKIISKTSRSSGGTSSGGGGGGSSSSSSSSGSSSSGGSSGGETSIPPSNESQELTNQTSNETQENNQTQGGNNMSNSTLPSNNVTSTNTTTLSSSNSTTDCSNNRCLYVRQGASGTGTSWSNAYGSLPGTLQRGKVYFIADGTYSGYTFDDLESGTQYITIRKATLVDHGTDTGWQTTYGDGQAVFGQSVFARDYYLFDGNTRDEHDWDNGNAYGFRIRMSSGKNNDGVQIHNSNTNPRAAGFITLRNTYIGTDSITSVGDRCIESLWDTHDILIERNLLRNCQVPLILRRAKNVTEQYNYIGPNNVYVSGQHIEASSDYETDGFIIRYNIYQDIMNTGFIVTGNGWNPSLGSGVHNWEIAHNVFWYDPSSTNPAWGVGDGVIAVLHEQPAVNWNVHHNTMINIHGWSAGYSFDGTKTNVDIRDNLWYLLGEDPNGGSTSLNLPSGAGNTYWTGSDPFMDWQQGDFRLKTGSSLLFSSSNNSFVGAFGSA